MGHRRRRISRVLLTVLALTISVGLFIYLRRGNPTQAQDVADAAAAGGLDAKSPSGPSGPPQTPSLTGLPTTIGNAAASPVNQGPTAAGVQPFQQSSSGPMRTETPGTLITQTPTSYGGPTPPASTLAAGRPSAPVGAGRSPAPATDAAKISIKPYQPSTGHARPGGVESITDGRAKLAAGKFLEARDAVNAALVSGRLKGSDADAARGLLSEINQTVVFSSRKFPDDRFGGTYQVAAGDRLDKIGARHALTADMLMRLNGLSDPRRLRAGAYIKVLKGPYHAVVSKSAFRLDLYLGGLPGSGADVMYVTGFPVGLGKDDSTPLGTWLVEPDRKVKNPVYYSPRGEGVTEADDPTNPLGEFWIGLAGTGGDAVGKESYGIHGTIEPASIGKMESMGCIRLGNEDINLVFAALVEGKSTVQIVD